MTIEELELAFTNSPVVIYVFIFFVFNLSIAFIDMIVDAVKKKQRRWKDTAANMFILFIDQLISSTAIGGISIVLLIPFSYLQVQEIPMTAWTWVAAIIAADFCNYWMHRTEHKYRFLWAHHSVHHSSEDYNLSIPARMSWVQDYIEWIFLIPMVLLGFNVFQTVIAFVFVGQYQNWIHTEKIGKLGILDEIFNTPSVHRVHHGTAKHHLDKNFGGILILWDKMFGTFQREDEQAIYGLTKNINTNNPFKINFIEYKYIWNDVKKCHGIKDKLKLMFGPLDWKPDYWQEQETGNTTQVVCQ
ncbi:MAG: sterol desaturase family protein [Exilibacterium sp.]